MDPRTAILDLLAHEWTESGIAVAVGTSQPTINRIKHGGGPSYELGARIVDLAQRESAARAPRTAPTFAVGDR